MTFFYKAFGLAIRADIPLPALKEGREILVPDLQIITQDNPPEDDECHWSKTLETSPDGTPSLVVWRRVSDGGFHLRFAEGIDFTISGDGSRVWSHNLTGENKIDAHILLCGIVFGLVLHIRGIPSLHAGAVAVNGKAVIIAGHSGYGKSTITSALALRGYPALADDTVALRERNGQIFIPPAFPSMRLLGDSAHTLFGNAHQLPLITNSWNKYNLKLSEDAPAFARHALLPAAVYILDDMKNHPEHIRMLSLSKNDALMKLSTLGYLSQLIDKNMRRQEFELFSILVDKVPVRLLSRVTSPAQLSDLCDAILADECNPAAA